MLPIVITQSNDLLSRARVDSGLTLYPIDVRLCHFYCKGPVEATACVSCNLLCWKTTLSGTDTVVQYNLVGSQRKRSQHK